ncbi:MAG: hypothetical protein ACMUIL_06610 [bacterium]
MLCLALALAPLPGESATVTTTIDAKYTRTDSTGSPSGAGEDNLTHEYNPRLSVKYAHPLTEWTDLSGEVKFDYKKEDNRSIMNEDTETREPQIELRLKSLIYDFKTGFKETWHQNKPTENRAFGHLLIQPSQLPELRLDYDHDETKDQFKRDKIAVGAIYKPSRVLRVKVDLKHEYTNNEERADVEDVNLSGEVKLNHTFSTSRPFKMEISYKAESLYQEEKDTQSGVKQDEFLQTLRSKLSYKPTHKTDMSLEYENKQKDDQEGFQDNTDQDIQFDLSQRMTDWLSISGRARKESEEERRDTGVNTVDTDKLTLQGQLRATPTEWFQFTFKVIDEALEEFEEQDPNRPLDKRDKRILEASLRSDFPHFLRSYQTLDFKTVDEDKQDTQFSEEERFMWKWDLNPLKNLSLKPEYIHSVTSTMDPNRDSLPEVTDEYKMGLRYKLSIYDVWTVDFSHVMSRKHIETRRAGSSFSASRKETNDDSTLDVDYQPFASLFVTSQITRKDYRIEGQEPSEEMSYSLKFDWSSAPYTWSTSYKYDDKEQANDTETFESKILFDFSDYTLEGEYKFTQTFVVPRDREKIITLRVKAVF